MLARLAWIGTALAAGLLLQIAVQINTLDWLPDFPVYLGLALLAGGTAVSASLLWLAAAVSAGTGTKAAHHAPLWLRILALSSFVSLAMTHAVLAVGSSSTAIEWWRNAMLWPALLTGVLACAVSRPHGWQPTLIFIWPLSESAAALLGCWYAPNSGEAQSFRAYPYVLIAILISITVLFVAWIAHFRSRLGWSAWGFLAMSIAPALICLMRPDTEHAQPLMTTAVSLRMGLLVVAVNRWLKWLDEATRDTSPGHASPTAAIF